MLSVRENMIVYRKDRLKRLAEKTDFTYVNLTDKQENQLFKSVVDMSIDRQGLLIFKNYYKHTFEEIEDITGIENAKGEYINLLSVLSETLALNNKIIANSSMEKVCKRVAEKINEDINREFETNNNKSKTLKISNLFSNKVASVAAIFLISFSLLFAVNAYADGKLFEWVANTFDKYTTFSITEENGIDKNDVDIEITYIPTGFKIIDTTLHDKYDTYYYTNDNKFLFIDFVYDDVKINLDTENATIEEFELDGEKIITWNKDNENYFVLSKNGVACQIYGNITKEDFIKIYQGISIKRK